MPTHKDMNTDNKNTTEAEPVTPGAPHGRNKWIALVLSIVLGTFGIDRFYLGKIGTGILKLITGGGFGIWWIIDIVLIATDEMKDVDGKLLNHTNPIK
jgi:TM2 domain-containing membrane protein YozV